MKFIACYILMVVSTTAGLSLASSSCGHSVVSGILVGFGLLFALAAGRNSP